MTASRNETYSLCSQWQWGFISAIKILTYCCKIVDDEQNYAESEVSLSQHDEQATGALWWRTHQAQHAKADCGIWLESFNQTKANLNKNEMNGSFSGISDVEPCLGGMPIESSIRIAIFLMISFHQAWILCFMRTFRLYKFEGQKISLEAYIINLVIHMSFVSQHPIIAHTVPLLQWFVTQRH